MARFERPDHASGTFFEIHIEGNVVTTSTGTCGAFEHRADGKTFYGTNHGRPGGRTYKNAAAAQLGYDKAVAKKRAEGFRRVDRPDDLVEVASETERQPELEAQIIAAEPGNIAPYLVYADWLQQRGDPRGELITIALAMSTQSDPIEFMAFKKREQALRFAHERAWLGPVVSAAAHRLKLDWKLGFIERARIMTRSNASESTMSTVLQALLASPVGCAVRSIALVTPQFIDEYEEEVGAAIALLPVPGLRAVQCNLHDLVELHQHRFVGVDLSH